MADAIISPVPVKVSWWLATKVTWSFVWRYILLAFLPSIVVALLAGAAMGLIGVLTGLSGALWFNGLNFFLGLLLGFGCVINLIRMMLNKGDFKNFTFQIKE